MTKKNPTINRVLGFVVAILPLIFGLITTTYSQYLRSWHEEKEVECCIEEAKEHIAPETLGDATLDFNGVKIRCLYSYRVTVLNTGRRGIDNLKIYVEFEPVSNPFHILADYHKTNPNRNFGKIEVSHDANYIISFEYELLNANDRDEITLLTNGKAGILVSGKQKDVRLICREHGTKKRAEYLGYAGISIMVIYVIVAIWFYIKHNKGFEELSELQKEREEVKSKLEEVENNERSDSRN